MNASIEEIRPGVKVCPAPVIRYCLLSYILCIRRLSARLRKRFPSCQEIMRTGLMRPDEAARIGDETSGEMYGSNWWLPLKVRKERSIFWREMI